MKRLMMVLAVFGVVGLASSLSAACRVQRVRVVRQHVAEAKVVVPFAVPVGVPVAVVSPYLYGYSAFATPADTASDPYADRSRTATSASPAEAGLGRSHRDPLPEGGRELVHSNVSTHCAACHGGATPEGQVTLERVDGLPLRDRLRAIRAVLSRRMPKGAALTDEQLRGVVEELAGYE